MAFGKRGSGGIRKWFWTIDNISLILLMCIICVGALLIASASPAVAERIKLNSFYFVHRQLFFLAASVFIMIFFSLLSERALRRFVLIGFVCCIFLLVAVLFLGDEVKGARRWINILGFTVQPSEFMKPFYIFLTGLILSERYNRDHFPGFTASIILHVIIVGLLILQPDFGMVVTFSAVLAGQFFLAGIPLGIIFIIGFVAILGAFGAYTFLPHVARRIDNFLNPETTENYQVDKSLEAYINGGLFGKGPGEGTVKAHLPDSHADFIFAVAGEELGAIFCSIILILFLAFIVRALFQIAKLENLFKIYTCGGIIMLFTLQTAFNIGVTLHLFPTKGMTLPFISYGGSSVLSFAIAFGIFLNLTKSYYTINTGNERILHNRT
jgi:cell division protein FtsW